MDRETKLLVLILAVALVLRAYGAFAFPLWSGPDEPSHFAVVQYVAENGAYPAEGKEVLDGSSALYESVQQPPLYYFLASPIYNATHSSGVEGSVHALRLLSVFLGMLSILFAFWLAKEVSENQKIALLVAGIIAFLPTHLVVSSVVNNGPLEWVFAGTSLLLMVKAIRAPKFWSILGAGILFGLAVDSKITSLCLLAAFAIAFFVYAKNSKDAIWKKIIAFVAPFAVMLPVFLRNISVHGELIPTQPANVFAHDFGWLQYVASHLFAGTFLQEYGTALIPSYRFAFFAFWLLLSVIALAGIALYLRDKKRAAFENIPLMAVSAATLLNLLGILYLNAKWLFPEGRLLFATLPVWAMLFVLGLQRVNRKYGTAMAVVLIASLAFVSLVLLANVNAVLPAVPWPVFPV
ncbi:MAG: glycosyltransferase family 39 protein [Candidatus Diapherotrites archaeon]